ncbi:LacI family DNA-binding transcriptional regulator (plasmid) [Peteryoungia desertarenae]|uniref:LacI family DNA-binding transcriptional regulator n=1 Tax=Peteryoungia desertarenae TaxID=1813451 RepID=A0ABX6QTC3_9HYPH|nr:LacI family DNA-binding transcriptional regulator [Peteryoungia desertarenae]QLF71572.1 LacI family DNA-binding transcriptional regulator [Peteryoungia desertarenae]
MTTIADVAQRAGVSPSTVSHVINGTRIVSKASTEAVEKAIIETGYSMNGLARSLARSRSNSIGVAVPAIGNSYFAEIIRAIELELLAVRTTVFLIDTGDDPESELNRIRALHQHRVDGVILAPTGRGEGSAMHYLHQNGVPTVLIDRLQCSNLDQVGIDNTNAVFTLFDHLARLGHHAIGFVAGQSGVATTESRIAGFKAAIMAHNLPAEDCPSTTGCPTIDDAALATGQLMRSSRPPTALIGGNNVATLGILRCLNKLGLSVPDDLAVVSFDDFEWADCFKPQLTVLRQPARQIGEQAARLLLSRIAGDVSGPRSIELQPEFVIRRSCGSIAVCRGKNGHST